MNIRNWLNKIKQSFDGDLWDTSLHHYRGLKKFKIAFLRVLHLVFRGFRDDSLPLHASALTYNTLMAIIPVLALSLALAKGFGNPDMAKKHIKSAISEFTQKLKNVEVYSPSNNDVVFEGKNEINRDRDKADKQESNSIVSVNDNSLAYEIDHAVDVVFDKVDQISFTALGGVGLIGLIWMVVAVLSHIELSFNRVWGIVSGRSVWRKITDYLSAVILLPFFLILITSIPVVEMITKYMTPSGAQMADAFFNSGLTRHAIILLSITLTFSFFIMFMPNTRVKLLPGLTGGFFSAILFLIWLSICAAIQVGVAKYSKLYGSFAVLPIILAWVYVSWQIILLGAEISFAIQNCDTYKMEEGARKPSINARVIMALAIVMEVARQMRNGTGSINVSEFSAKKKIPIRFINEVVEELIAEGYLAELADKKENYVLLKSPSTITVQEITNCVMKVGAGPKKLGLIGLEPSLDSIAEAISSPKMIPYADETIETLIKA